jgi:hypothetical protein
MMKSLSRFRIDTYLSTVFSPSLYGILSIARLAGMLARKIKAVPAICQIPSLLPLAQSIMLMRVISLVSPQFSG